MSDLVNLMSTVAYSGNIRCSYTWTIKNFKNLKEKKSEILFSDIFEIHEPDGRNTRWRLKFYPRGHIKAQDGDMSLFLEYMNNFVDVKISFECSIWDETTKTKQNSFKVNDHLYTKEISKDWGWSIFCTADVIQGHPEWFSDEI